MKRVAIPTMHLYGLGGGARAVAWFCHALKALGYRVDLFTTTSIPPTVRGWLPRDVGVAGYHPACANGYDLLLNINHFGYALPMAKQNLAFVFQPHRQNKPLPGYELWAVSQYTVEQIEAQWGMEAKHIYIPISNGFRPMRKEQWIAHCSRFVKPTPYADKGHIQMIMAFMQGYDAGLLKDWELQMVGSVDPGMEGYFESLKAIALRYPVYFHLGATDADTRFILGCSPIYWHMTGVSMPNIPGAQEHLGLTPLEAMAAGCVPISYKSGGPLETIIQGQTGFLVENTQELLQTTELMINNLNMWAAISDQAHRVAMSWQDYPAFVDRVQSMVATGEIAPLPAPVPLCTTFTEQDVTIIVPVHNQWEMTYTFLNSLVTTASPGKIVVVDNASTDETQEQMEQIEGISYLRLDENEGYAGGIFAALESNLVEDTPLVLLVNNDMECMDAGWLQYLVGFMTPDIGIVGPKLMYPDGRLQFAGGLIDWNRPDIGFHRWYGQPNHPGASSIERVPFITGACMLMRREYLDDTPPEFLEGLNYEDLHWCLTCWVSGRDVQYVPCTRLIHHEAVTKKANPASRDATMHNRRLFQELWGTRWLEDGKLARVRALNASLLVQEYSQ